MIMYVIRNNVRNSGILDDNVLSMNKEFKNSHEIARACGQIEATKQVIKGTPRREVVRTSLYTQLRGV